MFDYIDEKFWKESLTKPDWYLLLKDDFDRLEKLAEKETDYHKRKRIKTKAYSLVEEAVSNGTLPLADSGDNFDAERQPIDTVVIHHTKSKPGMALERLNAIQLLRIYGDYFANPTSLQERHLKGQPVWSGHFYKSRQVFWCYHWLIREDGKRERILEDRYIGWHAGNWDVNTRSVGVCIDDDLSEKEPSERVIQSIAETIREYYPAVGASKIVGHCEVNHKTKCPGHLFLESWKQKLIDSL
jgi:N-acetylmuramoyl-L-alanine amidase